LSSIFDEISKIGFSVTDVTKISDRYSTESDNKPTGSSSTCGSKNNIDKFIHGARMISNHTPI
jgi:hypothetical protein